MADHKIYKVRDRETGKIITFKWREPQPPTEDDLKAIFAEAQRVPSATETQRQLVSEVQGQALDDVYGEAMAQGIIEPEISPEERLEAYKKIRPYLVPIVEGLGLGLGSVAGSSAGPAGMVLGGGLTFAGARRGIKLFDEYMGYAEPETVGEAFAQTAKDVKTGAELEMAGQIAGPVLKAVGKAVTYPVRKVAGKIAEKVDIPITKRGTARKALKIFRETSEGTPLTQPQIEQNIRVAKELESRIPGLKFTQGQLTNDASAIALERSLARRGGQDLAQHQREFANKVLREYYARKVAGAGRPADFIKPLQAQKEKIEGAISTAEDLVNKEVKRLSKYMDTQTIGKTIKGSLSAAEEATLRQASKLYDQIPNVKLPSKKLISNLKAFVKEEESIIEPRAKKMLDLITRKATKNGKPAKIGFQALRRIRTRIGRNIQEATSGVNPNREDKRQLKALLNIIEDAQSQVKEVDPNIAQAYEAATKFYREKYIPLFRQGTVADVLRKGPRGEETRIAMANIAKKFYTLDGIDDFMRAVGDNAEAKQAMRDYVSFDFINNAVDPSTDKIVTKKAMRWLANNAKKLQKLGLYKEFKNIATLSENVDELLKYRDVFNKSVAGRILEGNVDDIISNAFRGSKDYAKTARELLDMVKKDKAATQGLKKAFADHIMKGAETTAVDFFQKGGETAADIAFSKSVAKLTNQIKKYEPAIKEMYKDEPKKIKALYDVWHAFQTLNRTSKSPVAGTGSDTFENFMSALTAGAAGRVRPREYYMVKAFRDVLMRWSKDNVNNFLTKAMFDPEYAETLVQMAKKPTPEVITRFDRLMNVLVKSGGIVAQETEDQ